MINISKQDLRGSWMTTDKLQQIVFRVNDDKITAFLEDKLIENMDFEIVDSEDLLTKVIQINSNSVFEIWMLHTDFPKSIMIRIGKEKPINLVRV